MRAAAALLGPSVVAGSIVLKASVNRLVAAWAAAISPLVGRAQLTRSARQLAEPPSAAITASIPTVVSTAAVSRAALAAQAAIAAPGFSVREASAPSARLQSTSR